MRKRLLLSVILSCCVAMLLTACAHEHVWSEATCTEPATCSECGQTQGEPLGHDWAEATCTEPKTCKVCGQTEGEKLGHDWVPATHESPKTCARCGKTKGEPLLYDIPAGMTDGYEFGEFDRFNSPASENGLGDTMIWFNGSYDKVTTIDVPEAGAGVQVYLATTTDEGGNKWLVQLDANTLESIDKYTELEGHKLCFVGQYQGYSQLYGMPSIMMERAFDRTTGNMVSSAWFAGLYG